MARYQLILAYDGTDFQGFQRQGGRRTVQLEVENALRQLGWQGKSILSAGRTDAGVHASGQVAAFDLDWKHPCSDLTAALNAKLPKDVAIRKTSEARAEFHPRYDAQARSYQYHIYCRIERDPLMDRFAWQVWPEFDLQVVKKASKLLQGEYDFSAFGRAMKSGETTIRHVFSAGWLQKEDDNFIFTVKANAFLYHMVRRMVFLQVLLGQGKLGMNDFRNAVLEGQKVKPGIAPAQGLFLTKVDYGKSEMVR